MNTQTKIIKSKYEIQADDFLNKTRTSFEAVRVGHDYYFEDDKETRDIYRITLQRGSKNPFVFKFGQSIANSGTIAPTSYDILACLTKYDVGSFENFCSEYGYDTNSRKAEKVYFRVQKEWAEVQRLWSDEEMEELREIN